MARVEITQAVLTSSSGALVPSSSATVQVYERGTTTPVAVYAAASGGSPLSLPLTCVNGRIEGWVEAPASLDLFITEGVNTYTQPWEAVSADGLTTTPDGVFNVLDYGADPTATSDSSAAIQAAIAASGWPDLDSSGWDRPHVEILVPPGRYLLNTGVTLDGGGQGSTPQLIFKAYGAQFYTTAHSSSPMLDITNSVVSLTQVHVMGGEFATVAGTSPYRTAIRFNGASECSVRDVRFFGSYGTGIEFKSGGTSSAMILIENCRFDNLRRGINVAKTCDYLTISNCMFTEQLIGDPLNWIEVGAASSGITIANNQFYGHGATVPVVRLTYGDGTKVIGNTFRWCYEAALHVGYNGYADGVVVQGNWFHDNRKSDIVGSGAQGLVLTGNRFGRRNYQNPPADNTYDAVDLTVSGGTPTPYDRAVIMGNSSEDTAAALRYFINVHAAASTAYVHTNPGAAGVNAPGSITTV